MVLKLIFSGDEYDFLIFIYAPSDIDAGQVIPTSERKIYVFPQAVVESTPKGKTQKNFNPKYVEGYEEYENAFDLIKEEIDGK